MVLSSLDSVFRFLQIYGIARQNRLCVFSSSYREGLQEQLVQENQKQVSSAVPSAHFFGMRAVSPPEEGQHIRGSGKGVREAIIDTQGRGRGFLSLDQVRESLESGTGGDHDVPYKFTLPHSLPQVLAWLKLRVRISNGDLLS